MTANKATITLLTVAFEQHKKGRRDTLIFMFLIPTKHTQPADILHVFILKQIIQWYN